MWTAATHARSLNRPLSVMADVIDVPGRSVAGLADLAGGWGCGNAGRRVSIGGYLGWGQLGWGCPLGAGFIAECGDGGCDCREEVVRVDRAGESVAFDLAPYPVLELGEYQADVLGVQRLVEFGSSLSSAATLLSPGGSRRQRPRKGITGRPAKAQPGFA